jgi:K+-transporting ATPase ATPase B chain
MSKEILEPQQQKEETLTTKRWKTRRKGGVSIFNPAIMRRATIDSFKKLDPRWQAKNPVMFVVEIGSVITTIEFVRLLFTGPAPETGFVLAVTIWLWFTVLFANFAEAMAEGRGKAQADTLRKSRTTTIARRLTRADRSGPIEELAAPQLRKGDLVLVEAGDVIPGDGEVIEGVASVDESAITGESAPVIRESGGDRSAVTGGTRVLSDWIIVRVTANPGETFLDRMISLVEGASRQKTPNEIALNHHLPDRRRSAGAVRHLFGQRRFGRHPDCAAGLFDPNHHRRPALRYRHRGDGPYGAAQRAGYEWARGGGCRRRGCVVAG